MATKQIPEHKAAERAMWALGDYHALREGDGLGGRAEARRRLRDRAGTARPRRRRRHRKRRDPSSRGGSARSWRPTSRPRTSRPAAARRRTRGVELEWVEADAEALPFADGEFDVVTSSFGAIFAPDHQAVADELLRVCRPGGTIGMANFTPDGPAKEFFETLAQLRAAATARSAVAARVGQRGARARALRRPRLLARADAGDVRRAEPGRPGRVRRALQGDVRAGDRSLRLARRPAGAGGRRSTRDFHDFAARGEPGAPGGAAEYPYEYLLVVATKR